MRILAVIISAVTLLLAPLAAGAQDDLRSLTSFEPFKEVIDGFAAGDSLSGLVQANPDTAPIGSSLQLMVNLGPAPAFVGSDTIPTGVVSGDAIELVALDQQFDGPQPQISPLHPWGAGDDGSTDISELFPDWNAYGEDGALSGGIVIAESPTVVWGLQLAEPFDETCAATRFAGRAWADEGLTTTESPLTTDLLAQQFGGPSHDTLADGDNTRFVELTCLQGGTPIVSARRVNADLGRIRPFGPLGVIALVKGNQVVFLMAERILGVDEPDIDPFFYANDPDGAAVPFEPQADIPALQPNPYDDLPIQIQLELDPEEEAFNTDRPSPETVDLVYTGERPTTISVGAKCPFSLGQHFLSELSEETQQQLRIFTGVLSLWAEAVINDGIATFDIEHPDGSVETKVIDFNTGRWESVFKWPADSGEVDCDGAGDVTIVAGSVPGVAPAPPEEDDGGDDEGTTEPGPAEAEDVTPGESGVPWVPIGVALALLATVAVVVGRSRTRGRDCEPERQAYAAARAAHDQAMKARDYWLEESQAADLSYGEQKRLADNPFDEPNRELGYPPGDEGDRAYQSDLEHWQQTEVVAAEARENLDGFRRASEDAAARLAEADAAVEKAGETLEQARIALRECEKSGGAPGGTAPPPPTDGGDSKQRPGCDENHPEGSTKIEPEDGLPTAQFTVVGGPITLPATGPIASWNRTFGGAGGGLKGTDLVGLSQEAIDAALSDAELIDNQMTTRFEVKAMIPTATYKARCGRVWRCEGGTWLKTNQTARLPDEKIADDVETISGHDAPSMEAQVKRNVQQAQERVEVLLANEQKLKGFGCD